MQRICVDSKAYNTNNDLSFPFSIRHSSVNGNLLIIAQSIYNALNYNESFEHKYNDQDTSLLNTTTGSAAVGGNHANDSDFGSPTKSIPEDLFVKKSVFFCFNLFF